MDQPSLEGVQAKLDRAKCHLETLEREGHGFIDRDPQPVTISEPYFDPESGWYVCYGIVSGQPPPVLGVILGDFLHCTRSALDHLIWQLVLVNGETPTSGPRGNAFPFATTEARWRTAQGSQLLGVHADHRAVIQKVQPYKAGDRANDTMPALLRRLSDTDKHQLVHLAYTVMGHPGDAAEFRVIHGPGRIVSQQVHFGATFETATELMRARVEGATSDTKVQVYGDVPCEIAFGEDRVTAQGLESIFKSAELIVAEFKPLFD